MTGSTVDFAGLAAMIDVLVEDGYAVFAPVVRDGAVVPARITSIDDLPRGVRDEQAPGRYRLQHDGAALFGYASTATSWKSLLFPARRPLWRTDADGAPVAADPDRTKRALLGVRSCDLQALGVHDRVLSARQYADPDYVERRSNTFLVAVTCGHPADTCFCTSMGHGPAPDRGFDLCLTELLDGAGHRFVIEVGSEAGADVLRRIPATPASPADEEAATQVVAEATAAIRRQVDVEGIRDLLYDNVDHPRWDDVASRCLSCTNCTLACPTCFCVSTVEVDELTTPVGRDQVWDSCFNANHSYLHGGPVRSSTRTRYRQWLTHKFASWIDQFGTSGCVGCGRCITWCPAGIDVTEELAAIRAGSLTREDES